MNVNPNPNPALNHSPAATPDVDVTPPPRRGCSCLTILVFAAAFFLTVLILGFMGLKRYIDRKAFHGMTTVELTEFNQWLYAPIDIPSEWLIDRPPLHEDVVQARDDFFKQVDATRNKAMPAFVPITGGAVISIAQYDATARPSVYENLVNNTTATATLQPIITTMTQVIKPLADKAHKLAQMPEYVINDRSPYALQIKYWSPTIAEVLAGYAVACAHNGDWPAALQTLTDIPRLARRDPQFSIHTSFADNYLNAAIGLSRHTSDTVKLKSILQAVVASRELVLQRPLQLDPPDSPIARVARQMEDDGFIRKTPVNRYDYYRVWFQYGQYLQWLRKRPSTNSHEVDAALEPWDGSDVFYFSSLYRALRPVNVGLFKPGVRELCLSLATGDFVAAYDDHRYQCQETRKTRARYDLFCLALARRIAALDGEPLPRSPEEFVPKYLPKFPVDPFTEKPFEFNAANNAFFSTGPDRIPRTHDDIAPADWEYLTIDDSMYLMI